MRKAASIRSEVILESSQSYSMPPHWSARRRHMTAGMKMLVPMGSNCQRRVFQGAGSIFLSGSGKKKAMTTTVTKPMGRLNVQLASFIEGMMHQVTYLIQKHQRHDTYDMLETWL